MTCGSEKIAQYHPPAAGNGQLSLMVDYQGGMTQRTWHQMTPTIWWAGRRYLTPHRELVPFGYFEQEIYAGGQRLTEPVDWQQTLDVREACIRSRCDYAGGTAVCSEVFVHAQMNVIAVTSRIDAALPSSAVFRYTLARPGPDQFAPRHMTWTAKPEGRDSIEIDYQIDGQLEYRGCMCIMADRPVQTSIERNSFTLRLDPGAAPVSFFIIMIDQLASVDYQQQVQAIKTAIRRDGVNELRRSHLADWQVYWSESDICLPEQDIEAAYHTALYHLRCIATPWSIPVAIADTHWHGRYFAFDEHFGFLGLLTSNHRQQARRVSEFRFQGLDLAYRRASRYGQKLFQGGARYPWETVETGEEAAPAGFWLDHIFHMAHIALTVWHDYRYSGDTVFLRSQAYPVIKACAEFFLYQAVYTVADGRTIIGRCTDLERLGAAVENAYMTTCSAIATLRAAGQAAALLSLDADLAQTWLDTAERLLAHLPHDGGRYIPFPGCEQKSIAVMSGLFPYGVIPAADERQRLAIADYCRDESAYGNMYPVGQSVCTWYAAWKAVVYARLADGEKAYAATRQGADTVGCFAEIYEINEPAVSIKPWFSTAEGTFVQGVNEMLIQSDEDAVSIAPAVPRHWRSFAFRLPCVGGLLADVAVQDGRLTHLAIIDQRQMGATTAVLPQDWPKIILPEWMSVADAVSC